jgi:TatD DNase family protein
LEKRKITLEELLAYSGEDMVVALGETGLDYHYGDGNRREQIENFELHIEASRQSGLPLVIHSRDADSDMADILQSEIRNGAFSFVLHCFCSGQRLARCGLDLGGFISLSGIVTFKNSSELVGIAKTIPVDRLLVETDSPYLAPEPLRGRVNEPDHVSLVARRLSEIFGLDYDTLCSRTTDNALGLFSKIRL